MANDSTKVGAGITGAVAVDKTNAAAPPTSTSSALTGFTEVGYIGEDGVTEARSRTVETKRAWQGGDIVRTLSSEGELTYSFVMLEDTLVTNETFYGVTVTQSATEGSFVIDAEHTGGRKRWVLTVIDGSEIERHYVPQGEITEVGDKVYVHGDPIGREVTLSAYKDNTIGGQARVWNTRLKS